MLTAQSVRSMIDPELRPALDGLHQVLGPLADTTDLARWRPLIADGVPGIPKPDLTAGGTVAVTERVVPGPQGDPDITLLILTPASGTGPWPAIYHTHGGGMVCGDRRSGAEMFLPYITEIGAVVVSVEYRLAPEHPDPAPVEDCYAGLIWIAEHAEELGIDPDRILIAGASAGGGLAAGTALLARDRGFPHLTHQILICPMLDDRSGTLSSQMVADGEGAWTTANNAFGWTSLLGDRRGSADVSVYAAPARATDLSGLPRTYVDVASVEVFRDEAIVYAQRLSQAGVTVDLHMWGGGFHGSDLLVPHAPVSRACHAARDEFLRRALNG